MDTDDLALAHTTAKLGSTGTDPQVTKKKMIILLLLFNGELQ
jgi:hypothetical protein